MFDLPDALAHIVPSKRVWRKSGVTVLLPLLHRTGKLSSINNFIENVVAVRFE